MSSDEFGETGFGKRTNAQQSAALLGILHTAGGDVLDP
jgi:hypothetical protein